MRQYQELGFTSRATGISNDLYGFVLDNIVICCVDCIVVHQRKMLLGLRTQHPYKGWWVMGGRMRPGESCEMTAQRVVEREVGLRIEDLARFRYVDTACYVWSRREQLPQEHGCHMEGNNFFLEISDEEAASIGSGSEDFDQLRWVLLSDVMRNPTYHDSIRFFAAYVREHSTHQ